MTFQILNTEHKKKTDVPDGVFSRVDRKTATMGIKQYHWFTKTGDGVIHRICCSSHGGVQAMILLCDELAFIDGKQVSQSEVGKGPVVTCATCVGTNAP
jgi:hypothetical protein